VTKNLLLPLLKFVAITGPITWWWMHGGQDLYFAAFKHLARPILLQIGVTNFPPSVVRDRLLNFLPFIALMMVTPQMSRFRRYVGIAGGMVVIFLGQVALTWWAWVCFAKNGRGPESMTDFFPAMVISDALPFVLWALLANQFLLAQLAKILPPTPPAPPSQPSSGSSSKE
jgi:hypothetical protein